MSSTEGVRVEAQRTGTHTHTRMRNDAAAGDSQQRLAWQREMERAQFAVWFKSVPVAERGMPAPGGAAAGLEAPARRPAATRAPMEGAPVSPTASMRFGAPASAGAAGEPSPQHEDLIPAAPRLPAGWGTPRAARAADAALPAEGATTVEPPRAPGARWAPLATLPVTSSAEAELPSPAESASSSEAKAFPATEPQALRLHAEMTPQGRAVWIGMQADTPALQTLLLQIVADLQRSFQGGDAPLHQVVCNGRVVWHDGRFVAGSDRSESPDPLDLSDPQFDPFQPRKT